MLIHFKMLKSSKRLQNLNIASPLTNYKGQTEHPFSEIDPGKMEMAKYSLSEFF